MKLKIRFTLQPPRAPALDVDAEFSGRAGISGPSGIGKSTLLRIIAGVERRAVGQVIFDGVAWQDSDHRVFVPPWQRTVGWVPQDCLLFPHLSVRENLLVAKPAGQGAQFDEVVESLEVGPLLSRRARNLSGGERQRVALGRALLRCPKLLLLDEPFAALDRPSRGNVVAALRQIVEKYGCSLVLVTHDAEDLRESTESAWTLTGSRLVPAV